MSLIALTTDPPGDGESTLEAADMQSAVVEFIPEARGHLATVEAAVLTAGHAPAGLAAVNAAFRGFHTIKGVASFLGLDSIVALAHAAEGLLEAARQGRLR